ncbi:MAG: hypothetical protein EOP04_28555 [Proteobacteria bacterium]|nr:MAG: hypothetical protein EOP04_28555 [Pseudomonadota bacterium]
MGVIAGVVAYIGSIGLAFYATRTFGILTFSDFFIIAASALPLPLLIAHYAYRENKGPLAALSHLVLAVVVHPAVQFKESYSNFFIEDQVKLLKRMHEPGISWWAHADYAETLARSLRADALFHLEVFSPVVYWAFPPSIVLLFWSLIFAFFFPKIKSWIIGSNGRV